MSGEENSVALPLRSHTILGVCEAIGEDFGFNPIFLRIPLAASVIWDPKIAFGTYFALGAVVLLSRLLFPSPKTEAPVERQQAAPGVLGIGPTAAVSRTRYRRSRSNASLARASQSCATPLGQR
jgi:phage shock protein PspC (stress-responsive transcriptional regulator)